MTLFPICQLKKVQITDGRRYVGPFRPLGKKWKTALLLTPRRPQLHQHVTRLFCVWRQYAKNNLGVTNRATERVLRKFTTAERVRLRRRAANVVFLDVKCRAEEIDKRVTQVLIFVSVAYENPGI